MDAENSPRLTIELVPQTSWFNNARKVLTEQEWDKVRYNVYRKANYRCEVCGGRGPRHPVECHEKWEFDDEQQVQRLVGLVALCPNCHQVKHIGLAQVLGNLDSAVAHLMRVNGWDIDTALDYVDQAFGQWQKRSEVEWTVDLGVLKNNTRLQNLTPGVGV